MSICYILYGLTCFGKIFDNKQNWKWYEMIRLIFVVLVCNFYGDYAQKLLYDSFYFYQIFKWFNHLSLLGLLLNKVFF